MQKLHKELQNMRKKKEKELKQAILAEQKCQWDIIRQWHEVACEAYKAECASLKALGVKKYSWPKAPKHRKKPTLDEIQRIWAPAHRNAADSQEEVGSEGETEEGSDQDFETEFWEK